MSSSSHEKGLGEALRQGFKYVKEVAIQYSKQSGRRTERVFLCENILLFVTDGQFIFRYGNISYTVDKQQFIFFRKGAVLEYKPCHEPATFFLVILKSEWVINVMKTVQWNLGTDGIIQNALSNNTGMHLFRYFELLRLYIPGDGNLPQSLATVKGVELLYCLSQNDTTIIGQLLKGSANHKPDITQVIENNIGDTISLQRLAQMTGRSISGFRRDFQSRYKMPPSRWIRQRKLEKAKELLRVTNMTVTSICYTLGFESIAHFSRIFKSYFGYSPSRLRMQGPAAYTEKIQAEMQ